MLTRRIILLVMLCFFTSQFGCSSVELRIRPKNKNGQTIVDKDLIKYIQESLGINESQTNLTKFTIRPKAVLLTGVSGSGKSVIGNYLNHVSMICTKKRTSDHWSVEVVESSNRSNICGFKIAKRLDLSVDCSPQTLNYSIIDTPDLEDTTDVGTQILNKYLLEKIMANVSQIKFMILLSYKNLKGNDFRKTLKIFSHFIEIDGLNVENLVKSTAILITRVKHMNKNQTEQMKEQIRQDLLQILNDELESEKISSIVYSLFQRVISSLEIFSDPCYDEKYKKINNTYQLQQLLYLIDNLDFMDKRSIQFKRTINSDYESQLVDYIHDRYTKFETSLQQAVEKYMEDTFGFFSQLEDGNKSLNLTEKSLTLVKSSLEKLSRRGSPHNVQLEHMFDELEALIRINNRKNLLIEKNSLEFLLTLLPQNSSDFYAGKEGSIGVNLTSIFNQKLFLHADRLVKELENLILKYVEIYFRDLFASDIVESDRFELVETVYSSLNSSHSSSIFDQIEHIFNLENFHFKGSEEFRAKKYQVEWIQKKFQLSPSDELYFKIRKISFNANITNVSKSKLNFFLRNKLDELKTDLNDAIRKSTNAAFVREIHQSVNLTNIDSLKNRIEQLVRKAKKFDDFDNFLSILNQTFKRTFNTTLFQVNMKYIEQLAVKYLDSRHVKHLSNKTYWLDTDIVFKLNDLMGELDGFARDEVIYDQNDLSITYLGHFLNMSNLINKMKNYSSLRTIKVFSTHVFNIDVNFKIDKHKYDKDAPNFVVISPIVNVPRQINVDLSCENVPTYPDNTSKARNGIGFGSHGQDGKAGLFGYNGGNFIILSNKINGKQNLNVTSTGGKGGPGQIGGDGFEGAKGFDALEPDLNILKKLDIRHIKVGTTYNLSESGGEGGAGGKAGRGGCGGYPGSGGQIILIENGNIITLSGKLGQQGLNGVHGQPGKGGQCGKNASRVAVFVIPSYDFYDYFMIVSTFGLYEFMGFRRKNKHRFDWLTEIKYDEMRNQSGKSGLIPTNYHCDNREKSPNLTDLKYNQIKRDYLIYIDDLKTNFKNSLLLNRTFIWQVFDDESYPLSLFDLIEQVKVLNSIKHIDFVPHLTSKILNFYQKVNETEKSQIKKVVKYLLASLASLVCAQKSAQHTALVIDLKQYLTTTSHNLKDWQNLNKKRIRDVYRQNYEHNLNIKIQEANNLIKELENEIENYQSEANANVKSIVDELDRMKRNSSQHIVNLLEERQQIELKRKLKKAVLSRSILGAIKMVAKLAAFLGPEGVLIGGIVHVGVNVIDEVISTGNSWFSAITENSHKIVNEFAKYIKNQKNAQLNDLESDVKLLETQPKIENILNDKKSTHVSREGNKSLEGRMADLPESSDLLKVKKFEIQRQYKILNSHNDEKKNEKDFQSDLASMTNLIEKFKSEMNQPNEMIDNGLALLRTTNLAIDLYHSVWQSSENETEAHAREIKLIHEQIKANIDHYRSLYKIESDINQFQNNLINEQLPLLANNLSGNSLASLDFKKWQINKNLHGIKRSLNDLFKSFPSRSELMNTFFLIENVMSTLVDIYIRIENYAEQIKLANYIADITQTHFIADIPANYQLQVAELEKTILQNVIREQYRQAVKAFSVWSFPFFTEYKKLMKLDHVQMRPEPDVSNASMSFYVDNLNQMLTEVNEFDVKIRAHVENHIQNAVFDQNSPFFEWSSSKNPFEIKRLLEGKKTTFMADVNAAPFDAIKFRKVYLSIQIRNNVTVNKKVNELLAKLDVELVHSGESFYKFKKRTYLIGSALVSKEKLTLRYRYECKDSSSECANSNESFRKLTSSRPLLSPYTIWEIALVETSSAHDANTLKQINQLLVENSNNELIVSLIGHGQYVSKNYVTDMFDNYEESSIENLNYF